MSKSTSMVSWMGNLWARTLRSTSRRRNARPVESLESRVLLATLVSPTKLTYQDKDGDNVEVTFSKPIPSVAVANQIFTFDTGIVDGSNTTKQQLRSINLANLTQAAGTTIITKAVRSAANGGDGFAAIGQIDATGIDIGAVTIDGDLGRIRAGDATATTPGLGALKVHSMGRFGTFTGAPNLASVIHGLIASLTVKTDLQEANILVTGGVNGKLGAVTIGGSLIGGNAQFTGEIFTEGDIGAVKITGDMIGGAGNFSGRVVTFGKLASMAIGGSMVGGSGFASGQIYAVGDVGAVTITRSVVGGTGNFTGRVEANAKLTSVTIGGSLIGSSGESSGQVYSIGAMGPVAITGDVRGGSFNAANATQAAGAVVSNASIASVTIGGSLMGSGNFSGLVASGLVVGGGLGAVKIAGNLQGGSGISSGRIQSAAALAGVTIGGSLIGGSGQSSGQVFSQLDMGSVVITGDVRGGAFAAANTTQAAGAVVSNAKLASVTIGGAIIGGTGIESGYIFSASDMGAVKVTGSVQGGSELRTGTIKSATKIISTTIGGSVIGGAGFGSGAIFSDGTLGTVTVTGSIIGGDGSASGEVFSPGNITSVTIGGSLIGGSGSYSGVVETSGELTTVTINGDIRGGSASGSADLYQSGGVFASRIGTLTLGGSLIAGVDGTSGTFGNNGAICVANDIANATIKGSIIGNTTNRALITARGQLTPAGTTDLAIGKLTVNGRVEHSLIHAGVNQFGNPRNADAQIGPVVVSGDWIASSLVAGALAGVDGQFGTADDVKISGGGSPKDVPTVFSKITSIVIGGEVLGTVGGTDHFGFIAENIGSFKVKGGTTTFPMLAGGGNDTFLVGLLGDVRVFELD